MILALGDGDDGVLDGAVPPRRLRRRGDGRREGPAHSRCLLPAWHRCLRRPVRLGPTSARSSVGLGPGAYTGLRIGVATARALAQADGRVRLAGVPTAAALALALAGSLGRSATGLSCRWSTAERREVFAAVYAASATASAWSRDGR